LHHQSKGASKNETLCLGYRSDRADVSDCSGGRNTNQWSGGDANAYASDINHSYNDDEQRQHVEHSACYGDPHRAWSEIDH